MVEVRSNGEACRRDLRGALPGSGAWRRAPPAGLPPFVEEPEREQMLMMVTRPFLEVPARWILIVTPLVIGAFIAASVYSAKQVRSIEDEAVSVATNGGPSIQELSGVRGLVRDIETATGMAIASVAEGRPFDRSYFEHAVPQLRAQLIAYAALPFYTGEREIYAQAGQEIAAFQEAAERVLTALAEERLADARRIMRTDMHPHANQASKLLLAVIDLNASEISKSATRLVQLRPRMRATWFLVHSLAVLVAVLLLTLTWRAIRAAERLASERHRIAEERAHEMEMFAARVAHDLKNPLAAIALSVALARRRADDPEQVRSALQRAGHGVDRTQQIIDGLLSFARAAGQSQSGERGDLGEVLGGVLAEAAPQAEEAGVELTAEPFGDVQVTCSAGALMSVLGNLVGNAIKYIVDVPAGRRRIHVRVIEDGQLVTIEVEDSGPGIPAALQQRIFEPYVRDPAARQPGLGLGLATVKRVVEGCGGSVGVRSAEGRGSIFWVALPRARATVGPVPMAP
jgi:signal transduction histidine kinase